MVNLKAPLPAGRAGAGADVDPPNLPPEPPIFLQDPAGPAAHIQQTVGTARLARAMHDPPGQRAEGGSEGLGSREAVYTIAVLDGQPIDPFLRRAPGPEPMGWVVIGVISGDLLGEREGMAEDQAAGGAPVVPVIFLPGLHAVIRRDQRTEIGAAAEETLPAPPGHRALSPCTAEGGGPWLPPPPWPPGPEAPRTHT